MQSLQALHRVGAEVISTDHRALEVLARSGHKFFPGPGCPGCVAKKELVRLHGDDIDAVPRSPWLTFGQLAAGVALAFLMQWVAG